MLSKDKFFREMQRKVEIITRLRGGESPSVIAEDYGISVSVVRGLVHSTIPSSAEEEMLLDMYLRQNASSVQIKRETGWRYEWLRYVLIKNGEDTRRTGGQKGRGLVTQRFNGHSLNEAAFVDCHTSPAGSYFLGLMLTDGNLYQKPGSKQISFSQSVPREDAVYKLKNFIQATHAVTIVENKGEQPKHSIHVCSKLMFDTLLSYKLTERKTGCQVVDERVSHSRDFWRGIIDGDGTVELQQGKYFRLRLGSTSLDLMQSWVRFCEYSTGVKTELGQRLLDSGSVVHTTGFCGESAKTLARILYDKATDYINVKYETYLKAIAA